MRNIVKIEENIFMVNVMFELKNQEQVPAENVSESVLVFSE